MSPRPATERAAVSAGGRMPGAGCALWLLFRLIGWRIATDRSGRVAAPKSAARSGDLPVGSLRVGARSALTGANAERRVACWQDGNGTARALETGVA